MGFSVSTNLQYAHFPHSVHTMSSFAERILTWFDQHGRKHLPWQQNPTSYRVWVSEIMLQQTQVKTVIPYYERFMQSFPDVIALANAPQDQVLKHWEGLGYYSRARNLHKAAQSIRDDHFGIFPTTTAEVEALSGIGRSTAAAILSLSQNQKQAILDGNVKRVLARYHAVEGHPSKASVLKTLWAHAESHLPNTRFADYTQAMMDMGATLCTRHKPLCLMCPIQDGCQARIQGNPEAYPSPKPKKTLPSKSAYTVIIQNQQGELLIQKRPPTGIWGGLWSFPEFTDEAEIATWLKQQNLQTNKQETLKPISHTFSHYRLHLTPIHYQVSQESRGIMEDESWLWYNTSQEFAGGLSSAANKLIKQLKESI